MASFLLDWLGFVVWQLDPKSKHSKWLRQTLQFPQGPVAKFPSPSLFKTRIWVGALTRGVTGEGGIAEEPMVWKRKNSLDRLSPTPGQFNQNP